MSTSMSFAQTYILASKVRSKLTKEASNPKSSLRVLVTQANMLDNLMDHIASETAKRNQKFRSVVIDNEDVEEEEEEEDSEDEESEDEEEEIQGKSKLRRRVSFSIPNRGRQLATSVAEYEVESDSDSDSDDDDMESESDSDYYYSTDEDDKEEEEEEEESEDKNMTQLSATESLYQLKRSASSQQSIFKELPSINLQYLSAISEEDEEDSEDSEDEVEEIHEHAEIPELSQSLSLTDDEDFEHEHYRLEHSRTHYKPRYQESIDGKIANFDFTHHNDISQHHHLGHQRHNAIISMESIL